jgi:hypothetical protein
MMINTIEQFGRNAGRVWGVLNNNGAMPESQLIELTSLRSYEFYIAVGWLARENKICKDNLYYKLDETNLTEEIGNNAGKIWHLLYKEGETDISYISKSIKMKRKDYYSALGWLARENKIQIKTNEEKL